MIRQLVRHLLDTLDLEAARASSMLNHHAVGLDYLNLFRSERLTVKAYIARRGVIEPRGGAGRYLVNPHDHNYDFETHVLAGRVANVLFDEDRVGGSFVRHVYDTVTRELVVAKSPGSVVQSSFDWYERGQSYFLDHKQIHTLVVDEDLPPVLVLLQYADVGRYTRLYVPRDRPARFDGLYKEPSIDDVERMVRDVRAALGSA
jgi:hypothetical protein